MIDEIVTITAGLHCCDDCGALVLPEFKPMHAKWHAKWHEHIEEAHRLATLADEQLNGDPYD